VLEEVFSDEAMRDIIFPVVPAAIIQIDVNIKKGMTYVVGNPGHGLRQTQKCGEDKPVNPNSPF
jgi:hypothetical protein